MDRSSRTARSSCLFIATGILLAAIACGDEILPPMDNGAAADFAPRRSGGEVDARIRIELSGSGLFRVGYGDLRAAGVPDLDIVGSRLRLFRLSAEHAIHTSTAGQFGSGDYFIFYATPFRSDHTLTNVFWLGFGNGGLRMAAVDAAPGSGPDVTTHVARAVLDAHRIYSPTYEPDNASLDHWFYSFMDKSGGVSNSFALATPDRIPSLAAAATLTLHGNNDYPQANPDHMTEMKSPRFPTPT